MDINQLRAQYKAGTRDFRGIQLPGANLAWANLNGIDLQGADLSHANLSGANLEGANLSSGTNLTFANLSRADLRNANLQSTRLEGANLEGVELEGAIYDETTWFPMGFDPVRVGAIPTGKLQGLGTKSVMPVTSDTPTSVRDSLRARRAELEFPEPPLPVTGELTAPANNAQPVATADPGWAQLSFLRGGVKGGFNLGAFLLPWFWFLPNRVWFGCWVWVLGFLPWLGSYITFGFALAMAVNGNEWAWRSRKWKSVEAFKQHQRYWAMAGLIFWGVFFLFNLVKR